MKSNEISFKSFKENNRIEIFSQKVYDIISNEDEETFVRIDISNGWKIVGFEGVDIWNDAQRELLFNLLENNIEPEPVQDNYDVREEQGIFRYGY